MYLILFSLHSTFFLMSLHFTLNLKEMVFAVRFNSKLLFLSFLFLPINYLVFRKSSKEFKSVILYSTTNIVLYRVQWLLFMAAPATIQVKYGVRSPKFICTHWLRPRNPPPPDLGSYTRALLVI